MGQVLASAEGRGKFLAEIRKSLQGGQEGGNLQIGIDLIGKIMKDAVGVIPHLGKFDNPDYATKWGNNVDLELVVPRYDRIFWDKLGMAVEEAGREGVGGGPGEMVVQLNLEGPPAVIPGGWWRSRFPGVGSFKMAVLGEKLSDQLATHTGVTFNAGAFIGADLMEY